MLLLWKISTRKSCSTLLQIIYIYLKVTQYSDRNWIWARTCFCCVVSVREDIILSRCCYGENFIKNTIRMKEKCNYDIMLKRMSVVFIFQSLFIYFFTWWLLFIVLSQSVKQQDSAEISKDFSVQFWRVSLHSFMTVIKTRKKRIIYYWNA